MESKHATVESNWSYHGITIASYRKAHTVESQFVKGLVNMGLFGVCLVNFWKERHQNANES